MRRRKDYFLPFRIFMLALTAGVLYLGGRLVWEEIQGQRVHQEIMELGKISYNQTFLEEIAKMDGLISVSPVYEIPVKLRWGDYSMETAFTVLDFDEFQMTGTAPEEIEMGNTPLLLIGKDTLTGLTDIYGNGISKRNLQKFWEIEDTPALEYCVTDSSEETDTPIWRPCLAVGCLTSPSEGIYISLSQASSLTEILPPVEKILLTTQGVKFFARVATIGCVKK